MSKSADIDELINILAEALRHKIGALVGKDELYSKKYLLEFNAHLEKAKKIAKNCHFNNYDKDFIKKNLEKKLRKQLEERDYIDNKKFDFVDIEINKVLEELDLDVK